jgi:hypothetical protein
LKQAKDEAANEVEAFKAEKEKQHKILEQQVKNLFCFLKALIYKTGKSLCISL